MIGKLINAIRCRAGDHPRLMVIQSFGRGKHVGCLCCGSEFAMHDGLMAFVPWDSGFEEMYTDFGYAVVAYRQLWRKALAEGRFDRRASNALADGE